MAELAPMPTARVRIATAVKAGFFFSMRSAYFKSCRNVCIGRGPPEGLYVLGLGLVHRMNVVLMVNTATVEMLAKNLCNLRNRWIKAVPRSRREKSEETVTSTRLKYKTERRP